MLKSFPDPRYLTALGTTRSEIIVPILSDQGEVVGTIDVESEQPNDLMSSMSEILSESGDTEKE